MNNPLILALFIISGILAVAGSMLLYDAEHPKCPKCGANNKWLKWRADRWDCQNDVDGKECGYKLYRSL